MEFNQQYKDEDFKDFIALLLKRVGLNKKTMKSCLKKENIKLYKEAFTHKSLTNKDENYEKWEFYGDRCVNHCVVTFLKYNEKFEKISNVDWLHKIKTYIISKKGLFTLGREIGIGKYIRCSKDYVDKFFKDKTQDRLDQTKTYISIYEDVFEAFIGVLEFVIDKEFSIHDDEIGYIPGPGFSVAYKFIAKILIGMNISLDFNKLWDPVSRLKEIYDSKKEWNFKAETIMHSCYDTNSNIIFTTEFYCYILGDQTRKPQNKILIGCHSSRNKDISKNTAALNSLKYLEKFNVFYIPKSMNHKN